jgi:hypothetical protein
MFRIFKERGDGTAAQLILNEAARIGVLGRDRIQELVVRREGNQARVAVAECDLVQNSPLRVRSLSHADDESTSGDLCHCGTNPKFVVSEPKEDIPRIFGVEFD